MNFPLTPIKTTNLDADSDNPLSARPDLLDAINKLNVIIQALGLDASLNVGLGVTPNGSYKLQLAGGALMTAMQVSTGGAVLSANTSTWDTDGAGITRFYSRGGNAATSGAFQWHTQSSNGSIDTTAMALTSSGKLMVGDLAWLSQPYLVQSSGGYLAYGDGKGLLLINSNATSGGGIYVNSGSNAGIQISADGGPILFFSNGNTAIFDNNGNLLVTTTTNPNGSKIVGNGVIESLSGGFRFPDGTVQSTALKTDSLILKYLAVSNDMLYAAPGYIELTKQGSVNGYSFLDIRRGTSTTGPLMGSITQTGSTSVAYNTTSDYRLKTSVRDADASKFSKVRFIDCEWIDGRHDCTVIAHELQEIYPDLVVGEKDAKEMRKVEITPAIAAVLDEEGKEIAPAVEATYEDQEFELYQQVNLIGLIPRMGVHVQKLMAQFEALATHIKAQDERIAALEKAKK